MEVSKFFPIANDKMGELWTLASIKDACVIEFGPAGTTHFAIDGLGALNALYEGAKIYSTHMDQEDVTFGQYNRLENALLELDKNVKPKYIFVMASSISSIIGADIESVCYDLALKIKAKLIPMTSGGLKNHYHVGVENMLETIVRNVVQVKAPHHNKYNILGMTIDRYNFASDVEEIKRMMYGLYEKEVNTTFTCDTSMDEIESSAEAGLNVVVRREALKAAKYMKEKFGIPYVYANLYGLENIKKFVNNVNEVDGYELNESFYNREVEKIHKDLFTLKRSFFMFKESKKCAIFGDYDTVIGMHDLMTEFGLEVDRAEVLYKTNVDEGMFSGTTEMAKMKYLKNTDLLFLLGDGNVNAMNHQAKGYLQISNPNFERRLLYPYTPFVGFRGMQYMMEQVLNIKL